MYVVPLVVLICLAVIAVAWTPLYALLIAIPIVAAFLIYAGTRPRAE